MLTRARPCSRWRHRYWRIAAAAPVLGFLLGVSVFGLMAATASPEARSGRLIEYLVRSGLAYGGVGLLVGIAALLGGIIVVGSMDRHLTKPSGSRTALASLGAAGGVLVLGIVFATVQWSNGAGGWATVIIGFSVALAIAAGIVAAVLVHRAERQSERIRPAPVEHPRASAWTEF